MGFIVRVENLKNKKFLIKVSFRLILTHHSVDLIITFILDYKLKKELRAGFGKGQLKVALLYKT